MENKQSGEFKIFEPAKQLLGGPASKFNDIERDDFSSDPVLCERAFNKLCELWNKNQKARNFVTHLCVAFLPYNSWNKVLCFPCEVDVKIEGDKVFYPKGFKAEECALIGIKVTGIRRIASERTRLTFQKLQIEMESGAEKLSDSQEARITQLIKEIPIEVRTNSFAYFSEKSDKHISSHAMTAILRFVPEMLLHNCPELNYAINKSRISELNQRVPREKQLTPKQLNKVTKANTFGITNHLDFGTLAALKNLKDSLEAGTESNDPKPNSQHTSIH